jgi:phage gpG-like protein
MIPKEFLASDAIMVLGAFASELENVSLQEVFRKTTDSLHEGFQANFTNTRGPKGTWPPHSPVTVAIYGPHPLLILTGAMLASVTQTGAPGSIENYRPREMEIGTSIWYSGFQQFGTLKIPARPFLWLDSTPMEKVTSAFVNALIEFLF